MRLTCGAFATCAVLLTAALPSPSTAQPPPIENSGRVIETVDGDVVVVNSTDRVLIVRRFRGFGRFVLNPDTSRLLLVMDTTDVGMPEGSKRLHSWHLTDAAAWPFGRRWDGAVTVDTFQPGGPRMPIGQMLHTDQGAVFIGRPNGFTLTPTPMAILNSDRGQSGQGSGTLDEIEQRWLAGGDDALSSGARASLSMSATATGPRHPAMPSSPDVQPSIEGARAAGPHRVGGNISPPRLTQRVEAVTPPTAREAGIAGVVILELTIGPDGKVVNARILRSIPLLDEAALTAVRQWEYEPTVVDGVPVPVILTATVNFQR